MKDPIHRPDPLATTADRRESVGWPKTQAQQGELERSRAQQFPASDVSAPQRSCDDSMRQLEAGWHEDFRKRLKKAPGLAKGVKKAWEQRLIKNELPLPTHLEDPVDYLVECRCRFWAHREIHRRTLAHAQELLEEFGSDFDRLRSILDRHQTGGATFAQIERLHETLMDEIAKATSVPDAASDGGSR